MHRLGGSPGQSFLYDSGRSNSGPTGRAFPQYSSGQDMFQEGVGYVENAYPFHLNLETGLPETRPARFQCARQGRDSFQ
jgi:hypothetical protein